MTALPIAEFRLEFIAQTALKKFCPPIHGQPVLEATLDLRRSCDHDVVFRRTVFLATVR
jgi:hypothetical protein